MLEFPNAMLPGIGYRAEASDQGERASVKLFDGKRPLVRATLQRRRGQRRSERGPTIAAAPDEQAADLGLDDLRAGLQLEGEYRPDWQRLRELAERWGLRAGWPPELLACVCGCSYLVGMRLPGRQALFSRLALRLEVQARAGG